MAIPENALVRFLTYKLSFDLANQILKKYESRMKELDWFLENARRFAVLKNEKKTPVITSRDVSL